jgi:hypothetical protein
MLGRRLLVLVVVLMGLTALAASLAPPPERPHGTRATPTATPAPSASAAPAPAPQQEGTVTARLSAARGAVPRDVTAALGDIVQLVVSGDVVDTVSIPGEAVLEPIDPDSPARVELYADTAGSYPIRLLDTGRRIGTLRISG